MLDITYKDRKNGRIQSIDAPDFSVGFREDAGPAFSVTDNGATKQIPLCLTPQGYAGEYDGVLFRMIHEAEEERLILRCEISNQSAVEFAPDSVDLVLGIDTCMERYPDWKKQFFPTMLRCEKTHLWGYLQSPDGSAVAVFSDAPVAAYRLEYKQLGHRIYTACLSLLHKQPLPERHPQNRTALPPGEALSVSVSLVPLKDLNTFGDTLAGFGVPVLSAPRYTLSQGEELRFCLKCKEDCQIRLYTPSGKETTDTVTSEYGRYTLRVTTESGKEAEAYFYCRKPWLWYLNAARKEAIQKPQKASTHAESWYGLYSGFLAAKHLPDDAADRIIAENADEILPLMFDFENTEPLVIPKRLQNTAALIGVLCDRYQTNPDENIKFLEQASGFGDWLLARQDKAGGYMRDNTLYTCVIYPAKSLLELVEAERQAGMTAEAKRHYESVGRAIDQLCEKLDNIETEGEQTFEDGMISCSALQIAAYALTLPENKREKYIRAAEYMNKIHACLEQNIVPDCRMNGGTLRFWEAQYDVMLRTNLVCSPHGWTAWSAYAKYYLYLLTGKELYLQQLFNTLGACVQLMDLGGNLRWAFAADPYITGERLVPDTEKPVTDGLKSVRATAMAYRGKWETSTVGECYIDMVSGWYRNGEQIITGGFYDCPLIDKDYNCIDADKQGGACDNDVHEIFKCMEETVLKKLFVAEHEDGSLSCYNGTAVQGADGIHILPLEEVDTLCTNLIHPQKVILGKTEICADAGIHCYPADKRK